MKKNIIFTIAKKEFFGYINSALAYTVIVPFLFLSVFLFLRTALTSGEASLRPYFDLLPWFLLLLAPALSMKLLTDEYKNNTLELLFAHPISESEIILGKFLGAVFFYICILITTVGLPISILIYSKADPGQMLGQYIGAFFMGATFLALGLAASAYVKNAISSFLLSASIGFVLLIIGLDIVAMVLPPPLGSIANELSVLSRSDNIARGLLDIRDVVYFITVIGLSLVIAVAKLQERKITEDAKAKRKLYTAAGLIVAIGIISNIILSSYPIRLDLTGAKLFTLSAGTKQTIKNLPDILNIKLFASRNLPTQMQSVFREVSDLLKDYEKLNSKVKVSQLYPDADDQARNEARTAGINEMTFNKMGSGKFEMQAGYLGISLQYGDKRETIPFVQDVSDLEYQLTRRIRKITQEKEKIIGIFTSGITQNQLLTELLETQYTVKKIYSPDDASFKDISTLLVIDNAGAESTSSAWIGDYLKQNGKAFIFTSGVTVNMQYLMGKKSQSVIPQLLSEYGITLNNDLVYDLSLNELLTIGRGNTRYLASYPYWLRAIPENSGFSPLSAVKSVSLGWPSSITLEEKKGITYKKLLKTSKNAGKTVDNFVISPEKISGLVPSGEQLLAVMAEKGEMRLVAVGTYTAVDDQFMENNRDNVAFVSNTVDWLIADKDLAAIPAKTSGRPVFAFRGPTDYFLVQYGNLLLPPLIVVIFAVYYLRRRKNLTRRVYLCKTN